MKQRKVTMLELGLVAGTRALTGLGIGLLLSSRLSDAQRRTLGWSLLLLGAMSTVPLAIRILRKPGEPSTPERGRTAGGNAKPAMVPEYA